VVLKTNTEIHHMKTRTLEQWRASSKNLSCRNTELRRKDRLLTKHNKTLMTYKEKTAGIVDRLTDELIAEKKYREQLQDNFNILAGNNIHEAMQDLKMYREYYVESVSRGA